MKGARSGSPTSRWWTGTSISQLLYEDGWRSVLAVPVLRDGQIIGVMVVRRKTPGDFSDEVLEFMETFASQSALAVFNARVFRELERKSAELEVASQHKSDFLASMSHELRTPLNAVIGFSEVLLERMFGELNERQEEYLRDILNSGKHLLELLNEILDLSKVEAGRMELELSVFPIRGVIEQALALVRERAALHGITVTVEIDPTLDLIESDELRFKQVMLNLLSNAVKFTPDGGHVAVRAAQHRTPADRDGDRRRDRHPARGPGAHLRVLPAGAARCLARGGHGSRPHTVPADRHVDGR